MVSKASKVSKELVNLADRLAVHCKKDIENYMDRPLQDLELYEIEEALDICMDEVREEVLDRLTRRDIKHG